MIAACFRLPPAIFGLYAIIAVMGWSANIHAQDTPSNVLRYDRATFDNWLIKNSAAKPEFKPNEVLTAKDAARIRPFVPPGMYEKLQFPQMRLEIIATRSHRPRNDFMECTEKYQAQSKLNSDGTLANNVCGQPFANSALSTADPWSGIKAQWNFDSRWQNYGQMGMNFLFIYDKFGGSHKNEAPLAIEGPPPGWTSGLELKGSLPTDVSADYGGGGDFERIISSFYQRTYFSHLPQRQAQRGLLDVPDAKNFSWKEFDGFFAPFDVRGQVFITYRYADSNRADDAWAYDPKQRRVRRISVEVKSDSLEGSDQTEEDFDTFSGRMVQWNWKFLGWKDLLAVMDSKWDWPRFFGPNGDVPQDVWSVRHFAVVERTPKAPNNPYGSVVMFWDAENWHPWAALAFDRTNHLYKLLLYVTGWTEDAKEFTEINHGVESSSKRAIIVTDFKQNRATLFPGYGTGYPNATADRINRLYDINKLEEVHR